MKKRVKIPMQNAKALLILAKRVREKHLADGEASLLKPLNWQVVSPIIDQAVAADEEAERLKREKVMKYQQRDVRLQPLLTLLRSSRDILGGVYTDEMKRLGEWGFDVMETRIEAITPEARKSA